MKLADLTTQRLSSLHRVVEGVDLLDESYEQQGLVSDHPGRRVPPIASTGAGFALTTEADRIWRRAGTRVRARDLWHCACLGVSGLTTGSASRGNPQDRAVCAPATCLSVHAMALGTVHLSCWFAGGWRCLAPGRQARPCGLSALVRRQPSTLEDADGNPSPRTVMRLYEKDDTRCRSRRR